jgi:hypothetical protein
VNGPFLHIYRLKTAMMVAEVVELLKLAYEMFIVQMDVTPDRCRACSSGRDQKADQDFFAQKK